MGDQLRQIVDRSRTHRDRNAGQVLDRRLQLLHAAVFRVDVRSENERLTNCRGPAAEAVEDIEAGRCICSLVGNKNRLLIAKEVRPAENLSDFVACPSGTTHKLRVTR